ncbi:MAG: shikimate kinase [Elusimicrobia bacterium]|nr:shikimate kinase [Elusimicrobiota bacterium]
MNLVLIGFMCSGKTRVGRELAARLGWEFRDTDEIVEKTTGARVPDIIRKQGEPAFRKAEREAVRQAATGDRQVIATGGGVPLDPDNIADLAKNGHIVWLKISTRAVLRRGGDLTSRPLIDPSDPLGSVERRLREREPAYAKAASFTVDVDTAAPAEIVEQIVSHFPALR